MTATTRAGAALFISLLGPLRVTIDGLAIDIPAPRQRSVLARLAVSSGHAVSDWQLIDAVWGDDPPATARGTLQTYVSQLRRSLGTSAIARDGSAYRLVGADVDIDRFTALVRSADRQIDPAERERSYEAAIALWRGEAVIDLAADRGSDGLRANLAEQRLIATELLVDAQIQAGKIDRAVPALEALRIEHPLRERPAELLMMALYRSGRQADALAVYRRVRSALIDELGLEPQPALQELEARILRHDPELQQPAVAPRADTGKPVDERIDEPRIAALPPRVTLGATERPLVGRRKELEQLRNVMASITTIGGPNVVLLRGEAGIGKTRLARELALAAASQEWLVAWGRCPADSGGAFQPFAEALDHLLRWRPTLAGPHRGLLGSILPGLASADADPLAMMRAGAEQRFSVIEALTEIATSAAAISPLLLVIDDVHWADSASLALIEHLAARHPARVLVVTTARNPEPTESQFFRVVYERLSRDNGLVAIDIAGLSKPEVRAMVDRASGRPASEPAISSLHSHTGGNPFFVSEVLAALNDQGVDSVADDLPLTDNIQVLLAQRLDHLTLHDQAVLSAAAAIGLEFRLADCAACVDLSERDTLQALERAIAISLVDESTPGTFMFHHALVQAAVASRTPRTRWSMLVERATAIAGSRALAEPGGLGRLVGSTLLAAEPTTAATAPLGERDPRLASSRATLMRIAAGASPLMEPLGVEAVVASDLTDERAGRTVLRWAQSMIDRNEHHRAVDRAIECGELARQLQANRLLIDAACIAGEAARLVVGGGSAPVTPELTLLLADAIRSTNSSAAAMSASDQGDELRAQLLVHRSVASPDAADRRMLSLAARSAAERCARPRWLIEAILAERTAAWDPDSLQARLRLSTEALDLCEGVVAPDVLGRVSITLARDHIADAATDVARTVLGRVVVLDRVPADVARQARLQLAGIDLFEGNDAAAAEIIASATRGGRTHANNDPLDPLATLLLVHAVSQRQLADALPSLQDAHQRWPHSLLWSGALAAAEAESGDHEAASRLLDTAPPQLHAAAGPGDLAGRYFFWLVARRTSARSERSLHRSLTNHTTELLVAGEAGVLGLVSDLLDAPAR